MSSLNEHDHDTFQCTLLGQACPLTVLTHLNEQTTDNLYSIRHVDKSVMLD